MKKFAFLLLAAACGLAPAEAKAHPHLTRSAPADGARLDSSPLTIRLWFSERPEIAMSFAQLSDSAGKQYPVGAAIRQRSDVLGIEYPVTTELPPGRYSLEWRTAGSDGHLLRGKLSFRVLALASSTGTTPLEQSGVESKVAQPQKAPADEDLAASPANSLVRASSLTAIVVLIGTVAFTLVVLKLARTSVAARDSMMQRTAWLGMTASAFLIVVAMLRLRFESSMLASMTDMPGMKHLSSRDLIMQTGWGFAFRLQLAAAITALVAFIVASRRIASAWYVAAIAALVAALTPALSGHAAATSTSTTLVVASDWLHVVGAGSWLGTLLCVTTIGIPAVIAHEGEDRWRSIGALVSVFSRLALFAVGAVLVSGVIASWVHLTRLADLWTSRYGVTLLVKLMLVAVTLGIGGYNFSRVQPQLGAESGALRLRKSATVELIAGLMILLVTGVLTGLAP